MATDGPTRLTSEFEVGELPHSLDELHEQISAIIEMGEYAISLGESALKGYSNNSESHYGSETKVTINNSLGGPQHRNLKKPENEIRENWKELGNCKGVDTDLFFPVRGQSTEEAKATCKGCAVKVDCLEFALISGEKVGVWGGKSEKERRRMRTQRLQDSRISSP